MPIPRLMDLKINIPNMRLSDEVEKRIVYRTDNYTNLAGKKNSSKKKSREVQMVRNDNYRRSSSNNEPNHTNIEVIIKNKKKYGFVPSYHKVD